MTPARWMTTTEAADELGVSPATVRRLIARGRIRARQLDDGAWFQVDPSSVTQLSRLTQPQPVTRTGTPERQNG